MAHTIPHDDATTAIVVAPNEPSAALVRAQKLAAEGSVFELEPSTRRAYKADCEAFLCWKEDIGPAPGMDPHEVVAMYLAHMANEGLKLSTIRRTLAAIGSQMIKADIAWSSGHPAIRRQLQSISKKIKDRVLKKLPVTDRELV